LITGKRHHKHKQKPEENKYFTNKNTEITNLVFLNGRKEKLTNFSEL
jgi:hypothetical protein